MALNVTLFESVAPEYASLSASDITRRDTLAAEAEKEISQSIWDKRYDHAVALLTAHMMKLGDRRGSGAVSSEKVGDLSRNYAVSDGDDETLAQTAYGREFLRKRRQIVTSPFII